MEIPMTITPELRQAIERAGGEPVRISDPDTNQTYYLVKDDEFDRIKGTIGLSSITRLETPEGVVRSRSAFVRNLAILLPLKTREVLWAAFQGDEQVGVGATETELYQLCTRRGLKDGEFYVGRIEPQPPEIEQIDRSLYEFEEFSPLA